VSQGFFIIDLEEECIKSAPFIHMIFPP